jgi:tetratricopeptide (TPR) repeat protein
MHKRFLRRLAVGLILAAAASSVSAQISDAERRQCTGEGEAVAAETRVANCTRLIDSGRVPESELFHAVNSRGIAWHDAGDFDRAIADFDRAIQLNPEHADAFYNRGVAWSAKGDAERAVADYSAAIALQPSHVRALNNRGDLFDRRGEFDRAIADYSSAIRLKPDYVLALYNRANAWTHKRDFDRAIADYSKAIRLDPTLAGAFVGRGMARAAKGDTDRAIADYGKAIRLDPGFALAFHSRGSAWRAKGDLDRAVADYDAAIRLRPDDAPALSGRGDAEAERGNHRKALADKLAAVALVEKTAENSGYFSDVGDIHYALGAYAEAEPWFATAVELTPGSNWDRLYLHLARVRQGKDARAELERYAATLDANTGDAYAQIVRYLAAPAKREGEIARKLADILARRGDGATAADARCGIGFALAEAARAAGSDSGPLHELAATALGASERCAGYHNIRRTAGLAPAQ